jgi:hypothetical protein
MSFRFSLLFYFISFHISLFSQTLNISGTYRGKNLYIQNPYDLNTKGFCTNEVFLNEIKIMDKIQTSAYEIDLSHLSEKEVLNISITHKKGCSPRILNAQAISNLTNFKFVSVSADEKFIFWITKDEDPEGKFFVEKIIYDKWILIKEIEGKGFILNNYVLAANHHSGSNRYRVKYVSKVGAISFSHSIIYNSELPAVTFFPKRVTDKIYLSLTVEYEIIDGSGSSVLSGSGNEIVCSKLPAGVYQLKYDNKIEKFLKK